VLLLSLPSLLLLIVNNLIQSLSKIDIMREKASNKVCMTVEEKSQKLEVVMPTWNNIDSSVSQITRMVDYLF